SSTDSSITFENQLDEVVLLYWRDAEGTKRPYGEIQARSRREQHTFAGHAWIAENSHGKVVGVFVTGDEPGIARINSTSVEAAARIQDPDSPKTDSKAEPLKPGCFVRSWNLWHRSAGLEEVALSQGGTETNAYLSDFHTSPNGEHALVFQEQRGQGRQIQFVESSPGDQVQPRIHSLSYDKPGDRIAQRIPRLFDIKQRSQIPVEEHHFTNAWSLGHVHWNEESDEVFLLYNARGHQSQRILGIKAGTGKVRTVLEETSATFIDYSQKTYLHWLKGSRQFLWASERSGRNHLYLIDAGSGEARPVTQGGWILRRVEKVDEAAGRILFTALGLHRNQDPYHKHLARIGIDGGDLTVLTHSDGDHEWEFSPGGALFATRWSRVDHPPVSELRRTSDGSLVTELDRTDATGITTNGFRPPIRFVAKGRDGVTDIHGILILPSQFDPSRKYPVLEDIYAGPHDFHVPKRWGLGLRQRKLAELGFIVAQIDGMGTNWREKSFHDYCWRNLRDGGFPDRIAWLKAAASTLPAMDLERVGIFGGSAGGQNALAALLHHGDFYKAAVADCGCHDNRMDKIWWNEAWMGYPVGPWYYDNSNVTHASKLKGKLLLTLGELDRNVDPASTM
ncbi:MAG: S9 family peptidase, partial [Verrucomicrobia bacterium]|nr:S9 family peptidase [Verrucomicrobiota bacterium]